jgi:hypothetical protein
MPRVRVILGALALLLVAGCSGDGGTPSGESSSTASGSLSPASDSPPPPRQRLRAAQRTLADVTAGAYTLRIDTEFSETDISERGTFNVPAEAVNLRRTITFARKVGGRHRYIVRIRSSPATRFLQMNDWGNWNGCWAEFDPDLLADLGIDLRGIPNIPAPVSVVLDARLSPENITPTSGPMAAKATVLTDAFTALQLLGVSTSVLLELPRAAARVNVPAHLSYFDEHPTIVHSVELIGGEVAEALRAGDAGTSIELRRFVDYRDATVTFAPADAPVRFERPPADQLLPPGATEDQTCAAHHGPVQNITVENVVVSRNPTRS